jgi:pimeloyl-ACP methyl ester carboxylesterase
VPFLPNAIAMPTPASAPRPQPRPFRLEIPDGAIADLKARLAHARLPDQPPGAAWSTGSDLGFMTEVIAYWRDRFDWRVQEARLNALPQFKVAIDGIDLHYLHVPGRGRPGGPAPLPLLLSHGWPGSVFEFLDLIPRLTDPAAFGGDPADAFEVVVPSLPGYGLSFEPGQERFGLARIANCFHGLMTHVLGHQRFGAQGGDWGSFITACIGADHPESVVGIHLNLMPLRREAIVTNAPSDAERAYFKELEAFRTHEMGYQWIQGTKPQTLAYALTDSPLGLAAWIFEKFHAWTDCKTDPREAIALDTMLANISLYWFTGAIGSSFWPYWDRMHAPWPMRSTTIDVPTGYAEFPAEILHPPRSFAQKVYTDIRRWSTLPRGGHFAALEQPEVLADEITEFFRPLRER